MEVLKVDQLPAGPRGMADGRFAERCPVNANLSDRVNKLFKINQFDDSSNQTELVTYQQVLFLARGVEDV
jgi:hypothetical protein